MKLHGSSLWVDGWRGIAAVVMLLAIAVRALLPVGYMPDAHAASAGVLKLVICSGAGLTTIALGPDGTPIDDHRIPPTDEPCAFSVLPGGASLAHVPVIEAPVAHVRQQVRLHVAAPKPVPTFVPCLGARAPPLAV